MSVVRECVCVCGAWVCVCVVRECVCEGADDWRRANVLDQCGRVYEKWNQYNISIVFVPKLVDMYIVFEEICLYIRSVYKINGKK